MPEESRVALLPPELECLVSTSPLHFQAEYAKHLGLSDQEYVQRGAIMVPRMELAQSDILIIPKRDEPDAELLRRGQTVAGWLYVGQTPWLYERMSALEITAVAFEEMCSAGRHVFSDNNFIAGKAGIIDALEVLEAMVGKSPKHYQKIAVLGRGTVAKGVFDVLDELGLPYDTFHRTTYGRFFEEISRYDLIISCIKWDYTGEDFIPKDHVDRMQDGCYVVDLTSEGISGSVPQPIARPTYRLPTKRGAIHIYNNDHVPTLWPLRASQGIGQALVPILNSFLQGEPSEVIKRATVLDKGKPTGVQKFQF